ncbi:hypothetical protein I0C86_02930 [Plantactinospora sp. S1510]|uniref:Uncharacterized protein n=1 Tax=Plantactinospora alkalitolerans TaxID=2789879 RepID=A0ABS0GP37_9ACTN|nr:DUF6069 family protein [Plantactinospora alkalitolerans]MBF9127955.1 hypothetical protein [Plantactinospora alkalitolerans]
MPETIEIDRQAGPRSSVRRAVTLVLAASAALVIWTVGVPIAGLDLTIGSGAAAQSVGPASVVVVPLLAGGAAWALLALLEGRLGNGRRVWRITAWTLLALSLLGPAGADAPGKVLGVLLAMHLVVGVTLIVGLAPSSPDRTPEH